MFVVMDLPLTSAEGLGYPNDLEMSDMLAFEIATAAKPDYTAWDDGGRYELLGVEFYETEEPGSLRNATIFSSDTDITCGE